MDKDSWSIDSPQTIDIDSVTRLRVAVVGGRVDVLVHEEPCVRLQVSEIEGRPLRLSLENGKLTVRHGEEISLGRAWGGSSVPDRAVLSLGVPAGLAVSLESVSGDSLVCGCAAGVEISTVSGSLMVDDTAGALRVSTVSGEAIVRAHNGELVAKTVTGEVTASGTLSHVRATTVSGAMAFDLHGHPRDLAAKSVSGDVTIRVPADTAIEVNANTATGRINLNDRRYAGLAERVRTRLGPSGPALAVRSTSVSGTLSVFHRAEAAERPVAI